jgi:transcriptional regulator with XRE-family HTH domain
VNEESLNKFIGMKIKEYRTKNKMTQEVLGKKIGVKNNTVSAYERGTISADSDTLFLIASALDIKVDDLFPPVETDGIDYLDKIKDMRNENLEAKDMRFFQELIEKTLSLKGEEREKFLDSIKFTVAFYNRDKN